MFEVRLELQFEWRFARHPSDSMTLWACVCMSEYVPDITITNNGTLGERLQCVLQVCSCIEVLCLTKWMCWRLQK